jgi:CheY-like chemotaxis protein
LRHHHANTGCGITEEDQTRIFREFFRVDKTRAAHDGLGLGLSIVKRLSALIGAEVSIESCIGKGTTFTVATQYPVSDSIENTEQLHAVAQSKKLSVAGKTIAVIDDDPSVLEGYAKALTNRGAVVIKIELAEQAFEDQMIMLEATQLDFIISDYRLGTSTGAELIHKLREVLDREIPAMIVTADTSPAHIQYFSELNIPVVHKPISFQQVIEVLESRLGQSAKVTSE